MNLFGVPIAKNPKAALSIALQLSILLFTFAYPLLYPKKADATLTTAYIRFDRQSAAAALSGVICMQSTLTSGGVSKIVVNFPATFSISAAGWTSDTTAANLPSGATAWPGITGPSVVSTATNSAIFSSTDLTNASNLYCFHFTGGSSTMGTAGNNLTGLVQTQTTTGVPVETLNYATAVTTGANSEQIGVTASVSASFSFALSGGFTGQVLALGVLNSSSVTTAPYQVTATVSTNAHNGFIAWVKGTNSDGLHSTTAGGTGITSPGSFPTVTDLASNTGYGLFGVAGTNTPNIDAGYTPSNGTSVGHVDNGQFNRLAYLTGVQSGTTFNIGARAKPTSTQAAANDYSDTLTVVASGSF